MACAAVNCTLYTRVGAHVLADNVLAQWASSIAEKRPKNGLQSVAGDNISSSRAVDGVYCRVAGCSLHCQFWGPSIGYKIGDKAGWE
jgi:hypothetical protein